MESPEDVMRGGAAGGGGSNEKIFVSVRVRPLNEKEIANNDVSDWECINDNTIIYKNSNLSVSERSMYPTAYTFDRVFGSECSTREVYEQGAKDVVLSVVSGINASIFAYGQTSSGKTYTMTGITRYAISDIYEYIEKHKERDFVLKFSAMEIYNESVRDLLNSDAETTPLRLLDDPERGTVVEKLTEETVRDWNHLLELLSICEAQRQIGETYLNETSSRSHQIIRLTVESCAREFLGKDNSSALTSTVDFVDLAGSERASQTLSAGTRLKEGCHINRSLLTLGTVIRKLSKGRSGHIPYRDSKLTRILQPSLGGNARTAIICTMSHARSHVEQSRNALVFASCAKEVTTNAQVNVVMSDKVLVKHLQKELARLESELRSPGSTSIAAEYAALLEEKDRQIEKLEKEVKDLILQRDIAQAQFREVLHLLGDDGQSFLQVDLEHYPHLRVQKSPDSENNSLRGARDSPGGVDTTSFSAGGHSRNSSEVDQFIKVQNLEIKSTPPPRLAISASNFSECDSIQGWDEIVEKQSNGTSEEEVGYIGYSNSGKGYVESNRLECIEFPALRVMGNGEEEEEEEKVSTTTKLKEEDIELKEDQERLKKEEQKLSCCNINDSVVVDGAKSSSPHYLKKKHKRSSSEISILTKSRSCEALLIINNLSPQFYDKLEKDCERKSSGHDENDDVEMKLSGGKGGSQSSSAVDVKLEVQNGNSSIDHKTNDSELRGKIVTQGQEDGKENEEKAKRIVKNVVKDVGLDPIQDEYKMMSSWPIEFKRLQRDIVKLWNVCHVSLVHRTYFFLLFKGDPTDAIYMEVELRRLTFLKDTFARGEKTVVRGQTLSLQTSIKDLRQERRMLSKQMLKKLSEEEREMLFLKWGIVLNSKLRRLQLAHRLWSSTDDLVHVNDSAYLVAKLVGFIEPNGQAPKEMFSIDFVPRVSTRSYSFKRGLSSLL